MKWFIKNPKKSFSFTLIELLVVVAIIGLLVSILMPALRRARVASQRTACRANLHQAGLAFQAYLDFLNVFDLKVFHSSSDMEKGSINFLNADGSVDE